MKKVLAVLLIAGLIGGSFTGCSNVTNTKKGTVTGVSGKDEVVGKVNGTSITREMLGEKLVAAEKAVIEDYVSNYLLEDFYKDIEVQDMEVEAEFTLLKGQVGESQWEDYLAYMGYSDDASIKEAIELYLKRVKLLKSKYNDLVEFSDSQLEEIYNENPNYYKTLTLDIVLCSTDEEFSKVKEASIKDGATIDSIASAANLEVLKNENVYFYNVDGLYDKDINILKVGDIVTTKDDSAYAYIAQVVKVTNTFEDLKEEVRTQSVSEKANELLDTDLQTFYANSEVIIQGVNQKDIINNISGLSE